MACIVRLDILEEIVNLYECARAVIIVGIDNRKGRIDGAKTAKECVRGAPGLFPALGDGISLGKLIKLLENVLYIDVLILRLHPCPQGAYP